MAVERAVRGNVNDEKDIIGMVQRSARIMSQQTTIRPGCSADKKLAGMRLRMFHLKQNKLIEHRNVRKQLQHFYLLLSSLPNNTDT